MVKLQLHLSYQLITLPVSRPPVCIDQQLGKAIRQTRLAAGRAAAEAADRARETAAAAAAGAGGKRGGSKAAAAAAAVAAAQQQQQADDVGAMLGAGAVTADAELDELVEAIEAQVCGVCLC